MEKLVYLRMSLAGAGGLDRGGLGETLRGDTLGALRRRGARWIQVNVVDPALGHPFAAPPDPDLPGLDAAVSMWVDAVDTSPMGPALPDPDDGGQWHGYLVTESEPLRNTAHPPGPDGRVPGFAQIVPLVRPEALSWAEWRRVWQNEHTPVAINTQSTFRYVQNVVVRPLTRGAPPYAAIVEESFPTEAASDLNVYFDAVGDDAKLARHMESMSESVDRFMDGVTAIAWTAEYLFREADQ